MSSYDECVDLVHLAADLGETLKKLVRVPLIGGLLRTMRAPAHAAGFGALQEFLETGYLTFRRISDIDRFLELTKMIHTGGHCILKSTDLNFKIIPHIEQHQVALLVEPPF